MTLEAYAAMTGDFEAHTLDARGFTHTDHIGVACSMLQKYDFLEAALRYGRALKHIAAAAGAPDKFNVTITLAFLAVLAERMTETPHDSFEEFLDKNPDLTSRSLLGTWYTDGRIGSEHARKFLLMPDRYQP